MLKFCYDCILLNSYEDNIDAGNDVMVTHTDNSLVTNILCIVN